MTAAFDQSFDHPFDYGPHRGQMDHEDRRTRMLLALWAGLIILVVLSLMRLG